VPNPGLREILPWHFDHCMYYHLKLHSVSIMRLLLWLIYYYTMSQKNVPPLVCYNFDTRERILIFFGRNVTDVVSSQKRFTLPPQITCASALPSKTEKRENCIFFTQMHCQNSSSRSLISSVFLTHDSYSCCCMTP